MRNPLLNLPPLDALRGFVAVGRRMSITLAAQDLCLTQSAVSRQIMALERHLGTPLLLRKHRAIALTEAGSQLFQLASPWLERLSGFTESVRENGRAKPVTITASIGVTSLWLLPRLGRFQATHPHIDVRVAASNRFFDLEQEGVDLAIRYSKPASTPANAIRLFGEELVPVANRPVAARAFASKEALLQQVLLELDDGTLPWLRWPDWLSAHGYGYGRPRAYLHFNQYDQVIQAALEGHGIALGRRVLVQPLLDEGKLLAMPGAAMGISDRAYWLIQAVDAARQEVSILHQWILKEAGIAARHGAAPRARQNR